MHGGPLDPDRFTSAPHRFLPEREADSGPLGPAHVHEGGSLTPAELSSWLEEHREAIAGRWLLEVRSRSDDLQADVLALISDFIHLLTDLLAPGLGAFREQVGPILQQASELYGNLGAHRDLAAGEAVEEVQLLRGVLFRFLYQSPSDGTSPAVGLRELLQLNRLVDLAVTYASVGHTDTLFFNSFHGTGVSDGPTPQLLDEVREQVAAIQDELSTLVHHRIEEVAPPAAQ